MPDQSEIRNDPKAYPGSKMGHDQPLILVTNDDGIDAPGIRALAAAMDRIGEVVVVAPTEEQSAVGHAITVREPVRVRPWPFQLTESDVSAHAVTGTPADCVKMAINQLLPRRPDLVVSGINRGPNTAVNVIYSGTVSAATEASILGIDSIAFSLCAWDAEHYDDAAHHAEQIARKVLHEGLPPGILLNVNIPALGKDEVKGARVTRQAKSRWEESFQERMDPANRPYYWLSGTFVNMDEGEGTDLEAIESGYISITPLQHDLTAHQLLAEFTRWDWGEIER
jgi:5'-nucleotidase